MLYEALCKMNADGLVEAKLKAVHRGDKIITNYQNAVSEGLLKVMSKMEILSLQS